MSPQYSTLDLIIQVCYYYITEMAYLALTGLFAEGVAAATEAAGALVGVEEVAGAIEAVAPAAQAAAESR